MISSYSIYLPLFYTVFDIVLSKESFQLSETKLNNERSLALYLAPDRNENLNAALMQQIFPSALMGHIFVFGSVMVFEVVGYTLGGKCQFLHTRRSQGHV